MNHYDVLEVSPRASAEVIRAAYKSLMQRYHPDKNPDAHDLAKTASRIAQAYEVLGDPARRAAYDATLAHENSHLQPQPAAGQGATATMPRARAPAPANTGTWYAWLLIALIIAGGALILVLNKKPGSSRPALPAATLADSKPSGDASGATGADASPASMSASASAPAVESAAERRARTITAFAVSLNIELAVADRATPGATHVLVIPELGFRVDAAEPARWVRKIETRREALIGQLLARLSNADYEQLIKADGDLYLKRLIAVTVIDGIGWVDVPVTPSTTPVVPATQAAPRPPIEVLLPQSFSVR